MRIAIPLSNGTLSSHFGHCEQFEFFNVDKAMKSIIDKQIKVPPPHEPGVLPKWLHEQGANLIITGGMGQRAKQLLEANGISVLLGVAADSADKLVTSYLNNELKVGINSCDH